MRHLAGLEAVQVALDALRKANTAPQDCHLQAGAGGERQHDAQHVAPLLQCGLELLLWDVVWDDGRLQVISLLLPPLGAGGAGVARLAAPPHLLLALLCWRKLEARCERVAEQTRRGAVMAGLWLELVPKEAVLAAECYSVAMCARHCACHKRLGGGVELLAVGSCRSEHGIREAATLGEVYIGRCVCIRALLLRGGAAVLGQPGACTTCDEACKAAS